jgi:predicted peptidase
MIVKRWCFVFAAVASLAASCVAQNVTDVYQAKTFRGARGQTMPYRLFVPAGYDRRRKYPLVLMLHGGGGRGSDNVKQITDGNAHLANIWTKPDLQARYPSFVVAPQCPVREFWTTFDPVRPSSRLLLVLELVQHLQKEFSLDTGRFYVTGQSMGGYGAWALATERPRMFAATVPVCGGGDESKADAMRGVAVWAFHGEQDKSVSVEESRKMIAAVRRAGGKPLYTEYKDEGHIIWSKVAAEPDLAAWMFAQKRN